MAADMPVKAPMPSVFNWSGWYIGGNIGWQGADDKWAFDPPVPGGVNQSYTIHGDSARFGGQGGFNVQSGNWLWGVEVAGSSTTHWNSRSGFGQVPGFNSETRLDNLWTIGPRLGWVNGQSLIYASGGFATGTPLSRAVNPANGLPVPGDSAPSHQQWANGWYIGGGVEYALTHHWILGVEYQYVALNKMLECAPGPVCLGAAGGFNDRDITARENIVRARLSYLFNSSN